VKGVRAHVKEPPRRSALRNGTPRRTRGHARDRVRVETRERLALMQHPLVDSEGNLVAFE
jgi:hypothetical protein